MAEIYEFIFIGLMLFTAFLSIKLKRTIHAVVSFLFMSVFVAILFVMLNAPYAAVFQILIYAGVIVILILVTLHTIKKW
ncbi:MAG: NADH-quinone oxidoreductase subunit J [Candidatus Methylarchaceae archaeon HK01B]|nr:NADH-quinone oxidoreductase subunit J [Candidatus Methylarchaceae archaeon HK01M]MCP8312447.1 NADH-quinone oxidoreductase subunit J [Candidatus Methylarchaceae archaeon HK02M1]MCP8319070.1 NADH-quinone oxidoreductase subunit J [Candidatus Methylarchaceae archaeon HK01B]